MTLSDTELTMLIQSYNPELHGKHPPINVVWVHSGLVELQALRRAKIDSNEHISALTNNRDGTHR